MKRVLTALAATLPFAANAADAISGAVERQPTNWQAIIMFLIFVVFTLGITYWAGHHQGCAKSRGWCMPRRLARWLRAALLRG